MSARARITQTFKRVNFDTIEHTFTVTDPKTYTQSVDRAGYVGARAETKLLEYACMENNRAFFEGRIKPFIPPDELFRLMTCESQYRSADRPARTRNPVPSGNPPLALRHEDCVDLEVR